MSKPEAAAYIAEHGNFSPPEMLINSRDLRRRAYRRAAFKLSPDNKETGDHEKFIKLQKAMEAFEE